MNPTNSPDPPPSPQEHAFAALVDAVLNGTLDTGADPNFAAEAHELAWTAEQIRRYAASVREHASDADVTRDWHPTPALPDPFPGEYRFRSVLGRGGFGTVWLAEDLNLAVPVALKTLHVSDPARLAALRIEAKILAGVRHPNVVQVHAWRQSGDDHYLVMQYIAGGSLADRVAQHGPLPWAAATRYAADIGDALVRVHTAGLVHRDVKPANVLWDAEADEAVLTDFGLAAHLGPTGTVAGTPHYMAPEAFAGDVTPAGDVYGLAATLFALATGVAPFPSSRWEDVPADAARGLPDPDPRCAGLPESIERLVRAGLAASPTVRPSMPRFTAALRGALNQSLADVVPTVANSGAAVHLSVARWDGAAFQPIVATRPSRVLATRDLQRVPPTPDRVGLRTGDRVRIQAATDRPGYLTVFNVGPTGNLNRLYPDAPAAAAAIEAHRPIDILDIELTPPAGPERVFAVWSRHPLAWSVTQLRDVAGQDVSAPYRATRDMQVLKNSVDRLPASDWHAVVLDLDHQPT